MTRTSTDILLDGIAVSDGFEIAVEWCELSGRQRRRVTRCVKGATVVEALGLAMAAVAAGGGLLHHPAPRIFMVGISRHLETNKET